MSNNPNPTAWWIPPLVAIAIMGTATMTYRTIHPREQTEQTPGEAAAEVELKKGTLPYATDMIERLDRSLGIAHQRIESQRVRINELEKKVDWLEQRIKETK